jgi:epoxyqueuosine reductase
VSAAITSPQMIKTEIISRAHELGFAECRIAAAQPAAHREVYEQWIADGKYGDMAWMARNLDRRTDPRLIVPGAQSIIVLALNYYQGTRPTFDPSYRIARYAWNDDYHDLIEKRLDELSALLTAHGGTQRRYVDTGPVLERDFATESGLGWNGKSTMQLSRQLGTWFFICEIITTLALPIDTPARDMCGKCTRCIDACPTGAITAPHRLDARKCISYLTIEHKGSIPIEYRRAIGDHLYGCDDCLDACPWNRFAQASNEAAFQARESVFSKKLTDFLTLTDEEFRALFARSPIKRIKRPAFLRNVCVVLGNVGTTEDIPALENAATDPSPLISEHATWAIEEILSRARHGAVCRI